MLLALCLALPFLQAQANTTDTGWLTDPEHPPVAVRLSLTGERDGNRLHALLEVTLEDDWKTYWRSPGEGGIAPELDWGASRNLERVEWHWPLPTRYDLLGFNTLGYERQVAFPLVLHLTDADAPLDLQGIFTLPSCTYICVLTDFELGLTLSDPGALSEDPDISHRFARALAQVPQDTGALGEVSAYWNDSQQRLQVLVDGDHPWRDPDVLVDDAAGALADAQFGVPRIEQVDGQLLASFEVSSWRELPDMTQVALLVTVFDEALAQEVTVAAQAGSAPVVAAGPVALSFLSMLGFALLGGLILNLMPCVLPVLGLKLHSVLAVGVHDRRRIRGQFLASAAGILVSFWLLAAFLWLLKVTGQAVGWGVQFQSAGFIVVMVAVTWLFALNLLGVWELRLPGRMNNWAATRGDNSHKGHFVQGMFATLLATPCSAPFLGTAVAFALGANSAQLVLIFTALGIGMALPWLLVAAVPRLAAYLPKPGRWMLVLKIIFGVMLLLTSAWLLSLLIRLWGGPLVASVSMLLIVVTLVLIGKRYGGKALAVTLSLGVPLVAITTLWLSFGGGRFALPENHVWQPFEQGAIAERVNAGDLVFVDVTADWCITCKANEMGVLLQQPVYAAMQADDVALLRADWTTPSPTITAFLRENARAGVPFNVVYGPGAPEGIPLPVLLRERDVMAALAQARGEHLGEHRGEPHER
ncbi:protein-disulfide reductase DsbD family protein [Marinimicrobium alkaliphilum]|uniref:protein-disulfide reductase DsbD family protein n=1 Tax=Marinimicrobium alkaliphilum TaxID=2202654 RepID=UPI0018E06D7D|nr:protein-disulfide reductase DsbD domain-containing protein [Marinimicrobium alkaliphilum]